jgi:hypothetical protein
MPDGFCIFANTAQIKEAVLNGVALDDDKREQFNKIEQVLLYYHFSFERKSSLPSHSSYLFEKDAWLFVCAANNTFFS